MTKQIMTEEQLKYYVFRAIPDIKRCGYFVNMVDHDPLIKIFNIEMTDEQLLDLTEVLHDMIPSNLYEDIDITYEPYAGKTTGNLTIAIIYSKGPRMILVQEPKLIPVTKQVINALRSDQALIATLQTQLNAIKSKWNAIGVDITQIDK